LFVKQNSRFRSHFVFELSILHTSFHVVYSICVRCCRSL